MNLTPEAIREFQSSYEKDFGIQISAQEAKELAERLIALFSVIYKPINKNGKDM